jgi:hypothetical protein
MSIEAYKKFFFFFCVLFSNISLHFFLYAFSFFSVTTVPTPASEITTLSLQSNANVLSTATTTTSTTVASAEAPSSSTSSSSSIPTEKKIDVTTISSAHHQHHDDSLKVLPLDANKTNLSNDKDDSTVTSSTQSPMAVNLFDTKIKPEFHVDHGLMVLFVNNDSDNQANQPQRVEQNETTSATADVEDDERRRLVIQEKEGRAINFPLDISGNNQNSTESGHMQINFVTTEKTHVMSFFDLSDVSMDHESANGNGDAVNQSNVKDKKQAKDKNESDIEEIIKDKQEHCEHNGTIYKVIFNIFLFFP